jgi:hypothetical protein
MANRMIHLDFNFAQDAYRSPTLISPERCPNLRSSSARWIVLRQATESSLRTFGTPAARSATRS